MKQKIISILTAASMLMSLIPLIGAVPVSAAGTDASAIQIGDYVQMGTYYEYPILWRCVAFEKITGHDTNGNPITDSTKTVTTYQDGYLPLMISDKILCLKAFDAKTGDNSETGSHSRDENRISGSYKCSSYWADSNIRCWLNSDAAKGNVEWLCGNPPVLGSTAGVKYNAYDQEAGFLTSFSGDEKAAIKTVTQKSILIECDKNAAANVTGTEVFTTTDVGVGNISGNYTNAYSELVTDTMFLPDVQQISNLYANKAILGDGYHRALISAGAYKADNCSSKESINAFTNSSPWHYWLRTPSDNKYNTNPYSVYSILDTGGFGDIVASDGLYGVRPTFYLNTAAALAGSGTAEAPYTIEHQHNLVKHDAVPATCTEDGTGEYYKCEGENSCGKMFSDAAGTTEISEIPTLTATGHSWGSWYITSDPTLTETGEAERVCENNGEHTEEAVLPVLTNTDVWTAGKLNPATCEKSGSLTYNSIYGNVTITSPPTGHSWGIWTITTEPTSTTGGTAQRVCSKYNTHIDKVDLPDLTNTAVWTAGTRVEPTETTDGSQIYTSEYGSVTVVLPATGHTHDWGAWTLTTEPTEEKTGIATRVCKDDENHKETKEVPELTDDGTWEFLGGSAPTCTADGSAEYDSVEYGTVTVIYPATGHSYGDWTITKQPTSTTDGTAERVCSKDAHKDTITLPVLTHTAVWTAGTKTEPTCTEDGSQTYTSIYGNVTIILSHTGHSWGSWSITLEPTLTETGTAQRVCSKDSAHIDTVDLPVLTNTTVWTAGSSKAATTTEDGWQEYTSDYGTVKVIIPAIGHTHDWGDWSITTKPTETTTGTATRVCKTNAEHTESVNLPVLTNTTVWVAGTKVDPTCTEDGSQTYTSTYGNVTVVLPATGHSYGDWEITTDPTLDDEGEAQRTCTKDSSHKDTITLPVLTNTSVWTPGTKVDPTCTVDGSQPYTSAYGTVTITLPATDHVWGDWGITAKPTLTTGGTAQRTCTIDSSHKDTADLPALTNTTVWTPGAKTEPTDTTDGSQTYTSIYGNVTIVLPATGHTHDWGTWSITTEPTETETGIATRVCKTNDEHKEYFTLPVLTNTSFWTAGTKTEPTETTDGSQTYTSTYGTVTVVFPATGHVWGDWSIAIEPTLTTEGMAQRTCTINTSHKDTKVLPVLTDTGVWTPGTKVDPGELTAGSQKYTSIYGEVTITLPATGHVWGDWSIAIEPTLTTVGMAQRTCTIDSSHKDTAALPALTDTDVWTAGARVEPTETTDGSQVYTSEYGNVTVVLPATGHTHDWGTWSITTEPTETETGIATRLCQTNDEHKDAVTLPVLTDTSVWVAGTRVEPTETTDGSQEYSSIYGTVTVVIPALRYSIEYTDGKAVVTVPKAGTHAVIFAAYDADGKLISVETQTVTFEQRRTSVSPLTFTAAGATKVKVMLWDSITNMKSLCTADEQ